MTRNNVRIAIEVSMFLRRALRELFQAGSGVNINTVAYMDDDVELGIIDGLDHNSDEWQWMNAVLMLMRTLHGILESAESEIDEESL